MTFQLAIDTEVIESRVTPEEVFYRVRATARNLAGEHLGSAEGACSTAEKKYSWRKPIHQDEYEDTPEHLRRVKYSQNGKHEKQVRQDVGELLNTILQMASKRAYVALVRSVTAASDIFLVEGLAADEDRPPITGKLAGEKDLKVVGMRTKTGSNDKGDWTLFFITFSDQREAATWSKDHADLAEAAYRGGFAVTATLSPGKKEGDFKLDTFDVVPA